MLLLASCFIVLPECAWPRADTRSCTSGARGGEQDTSHQHSRCLYPFQAMVATTSPHLQRSGGTVCNFRQVESWLTFLAEKVDSSPDAQLLESQSHELGPPVNVDIRADVIPALHSDRDNLYEGWKLKRALLVLL